MGMKNRHPNTRRLMLLFCILVFGVLLAGCSSKEYIKGSTNYVLPGATLPLNPGLTECVKDHWASDDLRFTLTTKDGRVLFEQAFTQEKDWDDTLKVNGKEEFVGVKVDVPIPSDIPYDSALTGTFSGTILCPKDNELNNLAFQGKKFTDVEEEVDYTMDILVVSAKTLKETNKKMNLTCLYVVLGIGAVMLLGTLAGKLKPTYRL